MMTKCTVGDTAETVDSFLPRRGFGIIKGNEYARDAERMMTMKQAKIVLDALTDEGFEAYLIGGIVRDTLLKRECHDIDICTSALPDDIIRVADLRGWRTSEVGRAFGCIIVTVEGKSYEVVTFRGESYGTDSHRPSEVYYGVSLEEDVKRRDFTMNGLAMRADGTVIDLVGGQADIKSRIVRCIGDGKARFAEDALRAYRACRFSAQLGFDLDEAIVPAIAHNLSRVRGLSVERVRAELDKTLLSSHPARGLKAMMDSGLLDASVTVRERGQLREVAVIPELRHLVDLPQNPLYHKHDGWHHTLAVVEASPAELTVRWAALLHDVAKGTDGIRGEKNGQPTDHGHATAGADIARDILTRLGQPKQMVERISWLVREHMGCAPTDKKGALRWLKKRATDFRTKEDLIDALRQLNALLIADDIGTGRCEGRGRDELFAEVFALAERTALYVRELAVGGRDLMPVLGDGQAVGRMLDTLLHRVSQGELANEKDVLLAAAEKSHRRKTEKNVPDPAEK